MTGQQSGGIKVYGIGNPLIDVHASATDSDINELGLEKGTMALIDSERGNEILKHLEDREKKYSCGGAAPNTMITLSALGIPTTLAGIVGNDELGDIYQKRLLEKNVISALETFPGDTGSCIVLVTPDYERTMSTRLGVCQEFGPEHVRHDDIAAADYLYFTGFMWDTESQKEALKAAIKTARNRGTKVVFDVADPFCVERHFDEFHDLIRSSVDILLANRDEARLLLGFDDPQRASVELAGRGLIAAIKSCADGSCLSSGSGVNCLVDAFRVDAVDSTGAGDNYAAGLLYGLIKGYSLADSGKLASYVAAQIVCQTGAQFDDRCAEEVRMGIAEGSWK